MIGYHPCSGWRRPRRSEGSPRHPPAPRTPRIGTRADSRPQLLSPQAHSPVFLRASLRLRPRRCRSRPARRREEMPPHQTMRHQPLPLLCPSSTLRGGCRAWAPPGRKPRGYPWQPPSPPDPAPPPTEVGSFTGNETSHFGSQNGIVESVESSQSSRSVEYQFSTGRWRACTAAEGSCHVQKAGSVPEPRPTHNTT